MQKGGGHFGVYSHDGDHPLDIMESIKDRVMPKEYHALYRVLNGKSSGIVFDMMYDLQNQYIKDNEKKLYDNAVREVKSHIKLIKNDEHYMMSIVGVCILVAKIFSTDKKFSSIPKSLPKNYPEYLRKLAEKLISILIVRLPNNTQGWRDISKRKTALLAEYKLFTGKNYVASKKSDAKPKKKFTGKTKRK